MPEYKRIDGNTPKDTLLMTAIKNLDGTFRTESKLILKNNLWWLPDLSMYVYYAPTHYKSL